MPSSRYPTEIAGNGLEFTREIRPQKLTFQRQRQQCFFTGFGLDCSSEHTGRRPARAMTGLAAIVNRRRRIPPAPSRQAIPRPMTPAPMTTVFGRCEDKVIDVVISDSLRRASRPGSLGLISAGPPTTPQRAVRHPSLAPMSTVDFADARNFSVG